MTTRSTHETHIIDLLKACAKSKDLYAGIRLHDDALKTGLLWKSHSIASSLISMYAKCGEFEKAWEVLEELPVRDTVSWSALISGHTQQGQGHLALNCFDQMQTEGLSPDPIAFTCILKACGCVRAVEKGEKIHDQIISMGLLAKDAVVGNALVDMYAKCGALEKALQVLEELPTASIVSWNALITGYAQHKRSHEALDCFERMQNEGISPDAITYVCILKACGDIRAMDKGRHIHDEIVSMGLLHDNIVLGNALIDMYVKCGALSKAHRVLEELPVRDVVSWSVLIAGYAQQGQPHEALNCFQWMQSEGIRPDVVTFICMLKVCGSLGVIEIGSRIHDEIIRKELLKNNIMIANALVDMYVKCHALEKAQKIHDGLPIRNVISWNMLIAGYVQHNCYSEALSCFENMENEGISPDTVTFTCILNACSRSRNIEKGKQVHDEITRNTTLLEKDESLRNALVDMYAKCGVLTKAHQLHNEVSFNNIVSWNSVIGGYADNRQPYEAFICFEQMKTEGHIPDVMTFTCILNACSSIGDMVRGQRIHEEIVARSSLEKNIVLGTALLDMYANCSDMAKAQEVFDKLSVRDVVSWSVLIGGYLQHGQGQHAFNCFEWMQIEDVSPDVGMYVCILKACGSMGVVERGMQIHDEVIDRGLLENNVVLGNALIDMYSKCGFLAKAQEIHDEFFVESVLSWNALIGAYVQQNQSQDAFNCFLQMQKKGLSPDPITFRAILKSCGIMRAIDKGKRIHDEIISKNLLDGSIELGIALVDMYVKCGMVAKAQCVHDDLPVHNTVSWNALIAGYVEAGQGHEALDCHEQMENERLVPDAVTFICLLKACGSKGIIETGMKIHENVVNGGLMEESYLLGSALVDMYAKCSELEKAHSVHDTLPNKSVSSWNALITGYAQHGKNEQALGCFQDMQREGFSPDAVTFACVLKACSGSRALETGKEIHDQIVNANLLEGNLVLGSCLVDMYAKCGLFERAKQVHDGLLVRNIGSWNALITGYVQMGRDDDAVNCFERLQSEGVSPDAITFNCILRACANMKAIEKGKLIHDEIMNQGLLNENVVLGTSLVDMYVKCGELAKAQKVLEDLSIRDVVSWSALIAGYAQQGQGHQALDCFDWMQTEGLSPNEVTLTCLLKACGNIGAVEKGCEIHNEIANSGMLEKNIVLGTALVDMYAKCGAFAKAQTVHNELPMRNVTSWNALITGYAQDGQSHEALKCFVQMQKEGISPNEITFVCLLDACNHSGKFNEAEMYFGDMNRKYDISPTLEHHTCMVVIFGSAGNFENAVSVIQTMPSSHHPPIWLALLSACRKWGNVELGRLAFDQLVQIDDNLAAAYVFMCDIYATAGMQEDAKKVKTMMKQKIQEAKG